MTTFTFGWRILIQVTTNSLMQPTFMALAMGCYEKCLMTSRLLGAGQEDLQAAWLPGDEGWVVIEPHIPSPLLTFCRWDLQWTALVWFLFETDLVYYVCNYFEIIWNCTYDSVYIINCNLGWRWEKRIEAGGGGDHSRWANCCHGDTRCIMYIWHRHI